MVCRQPGVSGGLVMMLWYWYARTLEHCILYSLCSHKGNYCDVTPTGSWNILEASRTVWHVTIPVRTGFVRVGSFVLGRVQD